VNDPKNPNLRRLYAVENHVVAYGKAVDVGAQLRFEALADVRNFANSPNLSVIESIVRVAIA
jgi:hypothetical protein